MKIKVTTRCEDSSYIQIAADSQADAEAQAAAISQQAHVIGCRFRSMLTPGKALLSIVQKFQKGATYDVHPEVAEKVIEPGYAEKA